MIENNVEFVWCVLGTVEFLCLLFSFVVCALMLRLGVNVFIRKIRARERKRPACARANPSHAQVLGPDNNCSGARTSV